MFGLYEIIFLFLRLEILFSICLSFAYEDSEKCNIGGKVVPVTYFIPVNLQEGRGGVQFPSHKFRLWFVLAVDSIQMELLLVGEKHLAYLVRNIDVLIITRL